MRRQAGQSKTPRNRAIPHGTCKDREAGKMAGETNGALATRHCYSPRGAIDGRICGAVPQKGASRAHNSPISAAARTPPSRKITEFSRRKPAAIQLLPRPPKTIAG